MLQFGIQAHPRILSEKQLNSSSKDENFAKVTGRFGRQNRVIPALCHQGTKRVGLSPFNIGNKTAVFFDFPANRTVEERSAKTVNVRTTDHEKTHFSTVLVCMTDYFYISAQSVGK